MLGHALHDLLGYAIGAGLIALLLGASYLVRRLTLDTRSTPDEHPSEAGRWDDPSNDPMTDIRAALDHAFEEEWPPKPTTYVVSQRVYAELKAIEDAKS